MAVKPRYFITVDVYVGMATIGLRFLINFFWGEDKVLTRDMDIPAVARICFNAKVNAGCGCIEGFTVNAAMLMATVVMGLISLLFLLSVNLLIFFPQTLLGKTFMYLHI